MSDALDEATTDLPVRVPHGYMICQRLALFGFTTRRGSIWTCLEHRDAGERVLMPPPSGQWSAG